MLKLRLAEPELWLVSESWLALTVQEPAATAVMVLPLKVQAPAGFPVTLITTGLWFLLLAPFGVLVSPTRASVMVAKVTVGVTLLITAA